MNHFTTAPGLNSLFAMAIAVSFCACASNEPIPEGTTDENTIVVPPRTGNTSGTAGSSAAEAVCNPSDPTTLSNCTGFSPCCTESGQCGISLFGNCLGGTLLGGGDGGGPFNFSRDGGSPFNRDGGSPFSRDGGGRFTFSRDGGLLGRNRDGGPRSERDGGTQTPRDSGTSPEVDSSVAPQTDSGTSDAGDGGTQAASDGGNG